MSLSKVASVLLASVSLVAGHGYVSSIEVDGTTYGGYLVDTYYYESDPPELIAWSTNATDDGYVAPTAYDSSDIICHRGSAPAALSAPVAPGGTVKMTWNTWPDDHHGPVITYLAKCSGSCSDVDKTSLEFFKVDAGGLIDDTDIPGTWASDQLIDDSYSRSITIPTDIEAGYYVLRHEIIALHGAEDLDGAQNYPQCINLQVTGSGTAAPSGTLGTALYKDTDPGIYVDIWQSLSSYTIPGPSLYTAGSTATATAAAAATTTTSTTAAAITTPPTEVTVETSAAVEPSILSQTTQIASSMTTTTTVADNVASTASSASSTTPGVLSGSCSDEGAWYCNGGTAFQRCVNGEWDASQNVAAGTACTAGISDTLTISAAKVRRDTRFLRHRRAHGHRQ
ncbi:glycosyl hydrolase family 61-domain-containing protein [Aspergillus pseudonomiae]|uniref:Glycosyl hydrolase family 61-domain-containing protein n=1 Tax=Aspergillus pseudonomiae TaxID=1506151 RepID=A0A5N7D5N5_9EURO|nr:glycosyl hydrolase family 61-domain-containing protein [Aspergillus pseudonomiae]KAB8262210.1 glycosyl hydrolase family 61-domain-containing protein [Aspergillus pseudonomiae]KAE8401644.1 glycosyl hydrolase family 61-domain-containing protein [Aspergillus pseudonomiae]